MRVKTEKESIISRAKDSEGKRGRQYLILTRKLSD